MRYRASLAPFRANKTLGIDSYKWILYGDDDTVWFPDVILKLVNRLDHETPYFLTDHIWFPEWKGESPCACGSTCRKTDPVHIVQLSSAHHLHAHTLLRGLESWT